MSKLDKPSKEPQEKEKKVLLGSVGTVLRASRTRQKIQLSEVSAELYIKENQLQALEAEDFDNLPQYTFTRGFALKYADYLGLDKETISQKFDNAYPENKRIKKTSDIKPLIQSLGSLNRAEKKKRNFGLNPLLFIVGVCVLGLAMFLMRIVNEAEDEHNSPKVIEKTTTISITEQRQGASMGSD